jgi:hypothetical protein
MDEDEDRRQFASGAVCVQSLDLGRLPRVERDVPDL